MNNFETAVLIYHEKAGDDNIEKKLKQTLPALSMAIKKLHVIKTTTIDELKQTCKQYGENVELFIVLGGDGTVHAVVNELAAFHTRPRIGILPGGTSNDFSRTLGIPQNLQAAAEVIAEGKTTPIDLAASNDHYFLNFWGIGLIAETSEQIDEEEKGRFGVLSYFLSTVRTLNQSLPFAYKIRAEDREESGEAVLIGVFNGRFLGTREITVKAIQPDDGLLDVIIVKDTSLASFRELLSFANPNIENENLEEVIHFQTKQLTVETEQSKNIDLDGEIYKTTPAEINILPAYIQMIHGDSYHDNGSSPN